MDMFFLRVDWRRSEEAKETCCGRCAVVVDIVSEVGVLVICSKEVIVVVVNLGESRPVPGY